ncbi:DUF1178 family protein [Sphingomonas montanisoli]|uniref:DUF1178 family protein n=1 Tax=Sphingomonas montanisoli TaxID=2606412 RepID=A0A5D9CGT2_9SPHN|nr:DUF1178 family protein [Sphingomonas montanisoli]TZG29321.1 DUF1178 family protein [Sphingomonas montanisoli]
MIVFDLQCAQEHVFEIWFGSSEDYEAQKARGLVACPYCGSDKVEKAVMAPRVAAKGNQRQETIPANASVPMAGGAVDPAAHKAMMVALSKMQAKMLEGSDNVGDRFADEARAMHLGETDARPIHGRTSIDEARALVEEGVPVAPLPLPVSDPGKVN